jgi:hypothetical protein
MGFLFIHILHISVTVEIYIFCILFCILFDVFCIIILHIQWISFCILFSYFSYHAHCSNHAYYLTYYLTYSAYLGWFKLSHIRHTLHIKIIIFTGCFIFYKPRWLFLGPPGTSPWQGPAVHIPPPPTSFPSILCFITGCDRKVSWLPSQLFNAALVDHSRCLMMTPFHHNRSRMA